MQKTILITGSTDGIGLETAKALSSQGHRVLLHGRNPGKLKDAEQVLLQQPGAGPVESYLADLSQMTDVVALATAVAERHEKLDVLINNAGVYQTPNTVTQDGLDVRFAVNTIAPYLLMQRLMPLLGTSGRVVNLSSAAQAPVAPDALGKQGNLSAGEAYAQSKLALTMWSCKLGLANKDSGPLIVSVNPGSLLGSKMVKEAYGIPGGDIRIGADILCRAALSDEFANAGGQYFDNDSGKFAPPHADALQPAKCTKIVDAIDAVLARLAPAG